MWTTQAELKGPKPRDSEAPPPAASACLQSLIQSQEGGPAGEIAGKYQKKCRCCGVAAASKQGDVDFTGRSQASVPPGSSRLTAGAESYKQTLGKVLWE